VDVQPTGVVVDPTGTRNSVSEPARSATYADAVLYDCVMMERRGATSMELAPNPMGGLSFDKRGGVADACIAVSGCCKRLGRGARGTQI